MVTEKFADHLSILPLKRIQYFEIEEVDEDAIVLFDGVFLMIRNYFNFWDIKIFIDISFDVAFDRVLNRDINKFESFQQIKKLYEIRYFEGQRIYFERCHPQAIADIILDNNDPNKILTFIFNDQ